VTETYTLTEAGWPRPVVNGWPIPWVTPAEKLSEVNEGRRLASVGGAICQVCGQGFPFDARAYMFVPDSDAVLAELSAGDYIGTTIGPAARVIPLDGAVLHRECARLTAARCPHVRDRGDLVLLEVPANDADPVFDDDKILRPSYAAGDCKLTEWPVPRGTR
jgi:hypothetical protein